MTTQYYVQLTDSKDGAVKADGGRSLFEVRDFTFGLSQTDQADGTKLGGTGQVNFGDVTLTINSTELSSYLSNAMINGTMIKNLDLFAVGASSSGKPAVHDGFTGVFVTGDSVDAKTGIHTFTLNYDRGVKESASQFDAATHSYTQTTVEAGTPLGGFTPQSMPSVLGAVRTTTEDRSDLSTYIRLTDASGHVLDVPTRNGSGGNTSTVGTGWLEVDSASYSAFRSFSQNGGGLGSTTLSPLDLIFKPGILEPLLLSTMIRSGQSIGIEIATYRSDMGHSTLIDDVRLGNATIAAIDRTSDASVHYKIDYSEIATKHYVQGPAGSVDATSGYSYLGGTAGSISTSHLPDQAAPTRDITPATGGGTLESERSSYFVQLTDSAGHVVTGDTGSVFEVSDFSFGLTQTPQSSPTALGGTGDVNLGALTLTVGSSVLSSYLSDAMAKGTRLGDLDLYAYTSAIGAPINKVGVHDAFNTVVVTGETVDVKTGAHVFTLNYSAMGEISSAATGFAGASAGTSGIHYGASTQNFALNTPAMVPSVSLDTYVRITDASGNLLGGSAIGGGGWMLVDSAKFGAIASGSGTTGSSFRQETLSPLDLIFAPGLLEPSLLASMTNSGQRIGIEIASYMHGDQGKTTLVDDTRLGNATVESVVRTGDARVHYTIDYSEIGSKHYDTASDGSAVNPTSYSYSEITGSTKASYLPTQAAPTKGIESQTASKVQTGEGTGSQTSTHYYVSLTDLNGNAIRADGGSLFEVSDFGFRLDQLAQGSPTAVGGTGRVDFGDVTLTLASSGLSTYLSNAQASGTRIGNLDLFAVGQDSKGNLSSRAAVHDGFTSVYVTGDRIDANTGARTFTLNYTGGVRESVTSLDGATVSAGTANGAFTKAATPSFTSAVTTTAVDDQHLHTFIRFTDASGHILGGSNIGTGSGGWIEVDTAKFGADSNFSTTNGGSPVAPESFSPLDVTFAAGILEPTLLATMTSSGQRIGVELASYALSKGHTTLVDDVRFGNATISASTRTSDAAVHYTIDYSEIGASHTTRLADGTASTTSYSHSEITTKTSTLPTQAAPTDNIGPLRSTTLSTGETHVPCYCTGTLILTARGEVPVEALRVGDRVVTAFGQAPAIRWIGHRHTDIARHPRPERVRPVRILAGAIAPGVPARDLRVSPGHAVAIDGVLVKAGRLVNGVSILREDIASVTYWHVELDHHDLLMAEGMPAESYVDCGNRHAFENGGTVMQMHPEFEALDEHAARTCLPLVDGGKALEAIRARLLAPLADRFTSDPGIALMADGVPLAPLSVEGRRYRFAVPEGTASLRLLSRSAIPSEVLSGSGDHRRLGIAIRDLTIDGTAVADAALAEGWHARVAGRDHCWTDGDAGLPVGRSISFAVTMLERYPISPADHARSRVAA